MVCGVCNDANEEKKGYIDAMIPSSYQAFIPPVCATTTRTSSSTNLSLPPPSTTTNLTLSTSQTLKPPNNHP
jgi:hypothetical protein